MQPRLGLLCARRRRRCRDGSRRRIFASAGDLRCQAHAADLRHDYRVRFYRGVFCGVFVRVCTSQPRHFSFLVWLLQRSFGTKLQFGGTPRGDGDATVTVNMCMSFGYFSSSAVHVRGRLTSLYAQTAVLSCFLRSSKLAWAQLLLIYHCRVATKCGI